MAEDPLFEELETFAATTNSAISAVAGPGMHVNVRRTSRSLSVRTPEEGVVLRAKEMPVMRLSVSFVCQWSANRKYMAIESSSVQILPVASEDLTGWNVSAFTTSNEPVVRFDYKRDYDAVPASHVNIHSHHPGLAWLMTLGHPKSRSAKKAPRTEVLHFPTGGHRFRPSLEDILEALALDFKLDLDKPGRELLRQQRLRYRQRQIAAVVGDDAEIAADALRELGYSVNLNSGFKVPPQRVDRLKAL